MFSGHDIPSNCMVYHSVVWKVFVLNINSTTWCMTSPEYNATVAHYPLPLRLYERSSSNRYYSQSFASYGCHQYNNLYLY